MTGTYRRSVSTRIRSTFFLHVRSIFEAGPPITRATHSFRVLRSESRAESAKSEINSRFVLRVSKNREINLVNQLVVSREQVVIGDMKQVCRSKAFS